MQAFMECMKALRDLERPTATIIWSASPSEAEGARRLGRLGLLQTVASGAVRKTAPLDSVLQCIRTVTAGNTRMDAPMLGESLRPFGPGILPSRHVRCR